MNISPGTQRWTDFKSCKKADSSWNEFSSLEESIFGLLICSVDQDVVIGRDGFVAFDTRCASIFDILQLRKSVGVISSCPYLVNVLSAICSNNQAPLSCPFNRSSIFRLELHSYLSCSGSVPSEDDHAGGKQFDVGLNFVVEGKLYHKPRSILLVYLSCRDRKSVV